MADEKRHPTDVLFPQPEPDDLSTYRHRAIIGMLGFSLPLLVAFVGWLCPLDASLPVPLDSISSYYYSGAVAFLVGTLAALAVYFITYDGYNNPDRRKDRLASWVAAIAAIGVASFPTRAPKAELKLLWWRPYMENLHLASALVLFGAFIFFSLYLFPKSKEGKAPRSRDKRRRNLLYRACGYIMLACLVGIGVNLATQRDIFWLEAFALWAFAVSWLTKGRADWLAKQLLDRRAPARHLAARVLDIAPRTPNAPLLIKTSADGEDDPSSPSPSNA